MQASSALAKLVPLEISHTDEGPLFLAGQDFNQTHCVRPTHVVCALEQDAYGWSEDAWQEQAYGWDRRRVVGGGDVLQEQEACGYRRMWAA
jgi:hypothetical protein